MKIAEGGEEAILGLEGTEFSLRLTATNAADLRDAVRQGLPFSLARVASQALATLGSLEKARLWLKTPNRALGCDPPLDLLDTGSARSRLL